MIDHDNLEEFADPKNYDREFGTIGAEGAFFLNLVRRHGGPVLSIRTKRQCPRNLAIHNMLQNQKTT